jgi:hypothetical protein
LQFEYGTIITHAKKNTGYLINSTTAPLMEIPKNLRHPHFESSHIQSQYDQSRFQNSPIMASILRHEYVSGKKENVMAQLHGEKRHNVERNTTLFIVHIV